MSKKQLYFIIAVLGLVLAYVLFIPSKPAVEVVEAPVATTTPAEAVLEPEFFISEENSVKTPSYITLEGIFLGLAEEETEFQKSFYYLLLNDGTEVMRIDLRPLLGYSTIDPVGKLGVDRGVQVVVEGEMIDGVFAIKSITPKVTE